MTKHEAHHIKIMLQVLKQNKRSFDNCAQRQEQQK